MLELSGIGMFRSKKFSKIKTEEQLVKNAKKHNPKLSIVEHTDN